MCSELQPSPVSLSWWRRGPHNQRLLNNTFNTCSGTSYAIENVIACSWQSSIDEVMVTAAIPWPTAPPPTRPCQERFARQEMNTPRIPLAAAAGYSTASVASGLDFPTAVGGSSLGEEGTATTTAVAEVAEFADDDDVEAYADSEPESDTSRVLSDTESEFGDHDDCLEGEDEDIHDDDDDEGGEDADYGGFSQEAPGTGGGRGNLTHYRWDRRHTLDDEYDTPMDMDVDMATPFRKEFGGSCRRRPNAPAFGDIDMNRADLSSDDSEIDQKKMQEWLSDSYNPMFQPHASTCGEKRRGELEGEDRGTATNKATAIELRKRHIKQPSLSRRKRTTKSESEWSLSVQGVASSPPPPPSVPHPAAAAAAAPKTVVTRMVKRINSNPQPSHRRITTSSSTQPRLRAQSGLASYTRTTSIAPTITAVEAEAVAANDLQPRLSSHPHSTKRIRKSSPGEEEGEYDTTSRDTDRDTPMDYGEYDDHDDRYEPTPMGAALPQQQQQQFIEIDWGMGIVEEPMDYQTSSHRWDSQPSPDRARDISRVLGLVQGLL